MKRRPYRLTKMVLGFMVGLLLGGITVAAFAQEWVTISRPRGGGQYDVRVGSFKFDYTDDTGERVAAVVVRHITANGRDVEFEQNYVKLTDCVKTWGKLVTTNLTGKALYSNDFIFGGGNSASTIAEFICSLARTGGGKTL